MKPTAEQQAILDYILHHEGLVKVSSVAGSGKTSLLVEIARLPIIKSGLYLAYTKSVATEAQRRFPDTIHCCTTHSLAYTPIVTKANRKLGTLSYKDIDLPTYADNCAVIHIFKEFCLSEHIDFPSFCIANGIATVYETACEKILHEMYDGTRDVTHEFYLKLFHIQLATGELRYPELDIVMLDEAGDINKVTKAIFDLLPAKRKVMVGDSFQNIFTFNYTIDCFAASEEGVPFAMTRSFRVSDKIASRIEKFCNRYIDQSMSFQGVPVEDTTIRTRAYIARTNATLIARIIQLNTLGIPYSLTRPPEKLFEQVLAFISMKHKGFITDPSLRYLQEDVDDYYESSTLRADNKTLFGYLRKLYPNDTVIAQNVALIAKFGPKNIIVAYEESRKHKAYKNSIILGTAHSTKGLEYDEVTIADDLNTAIEDIVRVIDTNIRAGRETELTVLERTELNLYYVACSRARKVLIDAKHLPI